MPVYKKLSELLSKNLAKKDGIHFYFLRHGQSTLNITNSVVGWTDVELSPKGRDQSMKINKALLPHIESFTSIHTSDLKRCKETLRLSFGFTDSNNLSHKITESQNLR
jgi:2,3-bisphosphoglycerate-dependent phosphoglycerate mutase